MKELAANSSLALSVKQPGAALIAAGRKTIEIRSWQTKLRGPILIPAAKRPDSRPKAWDRLTSPKVERLAQLTGGIVGACHIIGCRTYNSPETFAADRDEHRNDPAWFCPPCLFGCEIRDARPVPFVPAVGQMKFFAVKGFP